MSLLCTTQSVAPVGTGPLRSEIVPQQQRRLTQFHERSEPVGISTLIVYTRTQIWIDYRLNPCKLSMNVWLTTCFYKAAKLLARPAARGETIYLQIAANCLAEEKEKGSGR